MLVNEALAQLEPILNKDLDQLALENNFNKGRFGHVIEKYLKLKMGSHHLDFEDGELKTATLRADGTLKEDFKIAKKWDKTYLEEKMENILLVVRNLNNVVVDIKVVKPLKHPIYKKYFDTEYETIIKDLEKGVASQKNTVIWVAKTNDTGNKLVNDRALYISRAFASHLFGYSFVRATKGKEIYKEILTYEQTNC